MQNKENEELKVVEETTSQLAETEERETKQETEELVQKCENKELEEVHSQVKKGKSTKKKILNALMFLLNIAVVVGIFIYTFNGEEFTPLDQLSINPLYLALVFLIMIVTIVIDVGIVCSLIKKACGKVRYFLSFKAFSTMRYYDNITPMSAGGQPFMISYLVKRGISGSDALSIPMKKFILQQFSWLIIALVGFLCSIIFNIVNNVPVYIFSAIGFVINLGLICFIFFGSASKKVVRGIAVWGLKVLKKLHIVKDYDKNLRKVLSFINKYQKVMSEFSHNKFMFFKLLFVNLLKNIAYFCIPFFIYCAFVETPDFSTFFIIFVFSVMVDLASSCFPLPGGTGMNELTFTALFSTYLPNSVVWAMLLWRIVSYYIWLALGIGIIFYDFIIGNRKNAKLKAEQEKQKQLEEQNSASAVENTQISVESNSPPINAE